MRGGNISCPESSDEPRRHDDAREHFPYVTYKISPSLQAEGLVSLMMTRLARGLISNPWNGRVLEWKHTERGVKTRDTKSKLISGQ